MSTMGTVSLFPAPPKKKRGDRREQIRNSFMGAKSIRTASPVPTEEIMMHVTTDASSARTSYEVSRSNADLPARSYTPSFATSNGPTSTIATSILPPSSLKRSTSSSSTKKGPMKSIFPEYDHSVSFQSQRYYPQAASPGMPHQSLDQTIYGPSVYSPRSPGFPHSIAPTNRSSILVPSSAPASVTIFPSDQIRNVQPCYVSQDELVTLWEAANGQAKREDGRPYTLKMTRNGTFDPSNGVFTPTPSESFRFGSSKDIAFYDFEALNEYESDTGFKNIALRRHDPTKGSSITVMSLNLESSERRLPPEDGLIGLLYPKAAAMMAVDESAMNFRKGKMPVTDPSILTEEAVRRAAERECCKLAWDNEKERYLLHHPGLNCGKGQAFSITIDELVGFDLPGARGTIKLNNLDTQQTLAALEFRSSSLIINTEAIIPLNNFYFVDVAVTALILVGIVEGRRNRIQHVRFSTMVPLSPMSIIPQSPLSVVPGSPNTIASPMRSPMSPMSMGSVFGSPMASPTFRPPVQMGTTIPMPQMHGSPQMHSSPQMNSSPQPPHSEFREEDESGGAFACLRAASAAIFAGCFGRR